MKYVSITCCNVASQFRHGHWNKDRHRHGHRHGKVAGNQLTGLIQNFVYLVYAVNCFVSCLFVSVSLGLYRCFVYCSRMKWVLMWVRFKLTWIVAMATMECTFNRNRRNTEYWKYVAYCTTTTATNSWVRFLLFKLQRKFNEIFAQSRIKRYRNETKRNKL